MFWCISIINVNRYFLLAMYSEFWKRTIHILLPTERGDCCQYKYGILIVLLSTKKCIFLWCLCQHKCIFLCCRYKHKSSILVVSVSHGSYGSLKVLKFTFY